MKKDNKSYCVGCTTCCQWGGKIANHIIVLGQEDQNYEMSVIQPSKLASQPNGDCIYLNRETGCTIHDRRPIECQTFDCRKLLVELTRDPGNTFSRVIVEAARIKTLDAIKDLNRKKKKKSNIIRLRP